LTLSEKGWWKDVDGKVDGKNVDEKNVGGRLKRKLAEGPSVEIAVDERPLSAA